MDWLYRVYNGIRPKKEPVAWLAIAQAIVTLAAAYGLELETDQVVGVFLIGQAFATWLQRRKVTPVAMLPPSQQ